MKDPSELYYDAVRLADAFKKKGNLGTHSSWKDLGIQVGLCFNSLLSKVNFLNGPLQGVNDEKEENEVVRGLEGEFIDIDILDEGNMYSEDENDSDYLDEVIRATEGSESYSPNLDQKRCKYVCVSVTIVTTLGVECIIIYFRIN